MAPRARRTKAQLAELIAEITRIDRSLLDGSRALGPQYSVAQRMSWAAHRFTTRPEDQAYCLLGLFNINIPLLYGEGNKAFLRLQEEIMRSTADLSILAWRLPGPFNVEQHSLDGPELHPEVLTSVLAPSAAYFRYSATFVNTAKHGMREFSISNVGIKLNARLYLDCKTRWLMLPLQCASTSSKQNLAIRLLHLGEQRYLRVSPLRIYPCGLDLADLPLDRYLLTRMPLVDLPTDKYLLTRMPWGRSKLQHSLMSMADTKLDTRTHLVQILPLRFVNFIFNPWPAGHYDRSDQTFFVGRDYTRDMCTIDIRIWFPPHEGLVLRLIALGWSSTILPPQFGLVRRDENGSTLDAIQDQVYQWHQDTEYFLQELQSERVPRVMAVPIELKTQNKIHIVSIRAERHTKSQVCRNDYFTISLSVDTFHKAEVPKIEQLQWEAIDIADQKPTKTPGDKRNFGTSNADGPLTLGFRG